MQSKPEHFNASYAEAFKDPQVVAAYHYRPLYPDEVFDILASLLRDEPRIVLDVGTGFGDIARRLIGLVERVDAVDCSPRMIEQGKQLLHGDHPQVHWISGKAEEVPLTPPYALITAGSSIHWMEWSIAFPHFRSLPTPNGFLALIYRRTLPMPWDADLRKLRARFSTSQGHRSADVVEELERRGFFQKQGEKETAPFLFSRSIDAFIESLHSRSGFARERMGRQQATDFDQQVRRLLLPFHQDGILPLQAIGTVTWGRPKRGLTPRNKRLQSHRS